MTTLTEAPPIESARLLFRGHTLDEFPDMLAMWRDPTTTRFIGGKPSTEEEVWARLHRYVGHWKLLGFGYWALREKTSGRFVGEVGFADFKRDIEPRMDGKPEAGWVLAPWAHGKGFATEAVTTALAWNDARTGKGPTVCIIDPGNDASVHVATKCGFRKVTHTTYKGGATVLFER